MGLTTQSFAAAGAAAGAAPVGITQIWINASNTTAIQYTVPAGKYFKGFVGHNGSQSFQINGVSTHGYFNNAMFANTASGAGTYDIVLAPGTTVNAAASSNALYIHGCEYDLPSSGLSSTSF